MRPRKLREGTGERYYGWQLRDMVEGKEPERRTNIDEQNAWLIACIVVPAAILFAALIVCCV